MVRNVVAKILDKISKTKFQNCAKQFATYYKRAS